MDKKCILWFWLLLFTQLYAMESGISVGTFAQEKRTFYTQADGLPTAAVLSVAITADGSVFCGTEQGLARFSENRCTVYEETKNHAVRHMAVAGHQVVAIMEPNADMNGNRSLLLINHGRVEQILSLAGIAKDRSVSALALDEWIYLGCGERLYTLAPAAKAKLKMIATFSGEIKQLAVVTNKTIYAATSAGLMQYDVKTKAITPLYPQQGKRSWSLVDVRGVALDQQGQLWFASPQGVGCRTAAGWTLYTGQEGLPYDDFVTMACGEPGVMWFGTTFGAIRFDGTTWEYRQGLRWLPNDRVNDLAITPQGQAWIATPKGVAKIERTAMTLAEKAAWYEEEIDRYHRRTPYEYVLEVSVKEPGDKSEYKQQDSDNDGLWTSMYGAGECFAYGATRDPQAKKRAQKAFRALRFLGEVTQGGTHPAPSGFVCRTILPTTGPDPNIGRLQDDIKSQHYRDKFWKVFEPRWPKSADGQWYWKTDTSSDELDGHYFLYGLYFDLVAETEAEKDAVRTHVRALTDHLIKHHCKLVDHDGQPTRWARYDPAELNHDPRWFIERGLNSLSMLSYLATTAHITGDRKYRQVADSLIDRHGYLQNMMNMKVQRGIGTGNQSDDEMAFMCYYNVIKYEPDPLRRSQFATSFWLTWRLEYPEMNPFFNFLMAAVCNGVTYTDQWGTHSVGPTGEWLEDGVETLQRFPLDRFDWRHDNSRRIDLIRLSELGACFDEDPQDFPRRGYRVNGKVIPVDECHFNHWNRNPFQLVTGGGGYELADGAVFLLPYYLGLYHGFIKE